MCCPNGSAPVNRMPCVYTQKGLDQASCNYIIAWRTNNAGCQLFWAQVHRGWFMHVLTEEDLA